MRMDVKLSIFLLLLLGTSTANIFKKVTSPCKQTNVQCLSENTFTFCVNKGKHSALMHFVFNCPEHYVCDDNTKFPCVKDTISETLSIDGAVVSNEIDPDSDVLIEPDAQSGIIIILTTTTTAKPDDLTLVTSPLQTTEPAIPDTSDDISSESTAQTEATTTESTTTEATTPSRAIESKISSTAFTQSTITEGDALPTIIKLVLASLSEVSSEITAPSKISFSNSFQTLPEINFQEFTNVTKSATDTLSVLTEETSTATIADEYSTLIPDNASPTVFTPNITTTLTTSPITTTTPAFITSRSTLPNNIASNIITETPASIPSLIATQNENVPISKETASIVREPATKQDNSSLNTLIRTSYTKNCSTSDISTIEKDSPYAIADISAKATPITFPLNSETLNSPITRIITPNEIKSSSPPISTSPSVANVSATTTTAPMFRTIPTSALNIKVLHNEKASVTDLPVHKKSQLKSKITTSTQSTPAARGVPTVFTHIRFTTPKFPRRPTRRPPFIKRRTTPFVGINQKPLHHFEKAAPTTAVVTGTTSTSTTSRPTRIAPTVSTSRSPVINTKITRTTSRPGTVSTPGTSTSYSPITKVAQTVIKKTSTITARETNPTTATPSILITRKTPRTTTTTITITNPTASIITTSQTNLITTTSPIIITKTTPSTPIITYTTVKTTTVLVTGPPTCTEVGFHAAANCNQYYECIVVWWWYEYRLRTCNSGYYYNSLEKACLLDDNNSCII